ncbi:MAG: hypothetical protein PHX08_26790 [Lachnospiraceae bacterium]|nr:hypothetical protein [Lachnospiraceae bacterium]
METLFFDFYFKENREKTYMIKKMGMNNKKKYLLIFFSIIFIGLLMIILLSPIMITPQGVLTRTKVKEFNELYDPEKVRRVKYVKDAPILLIDFRMNAKLEVYRFQGLDKKKEYTFKKINPWMWVEKKEREILQVYCVVVNEDEKYIFVYMAP